MDLPSIVILAVLCGLALITVKSSLKRISRGCCSPSDEEMIKKVKTADRNRDHYRYEALLRIDGMICRNCALKVENALNRLDGVWAKADVSAGKADVLMKEKRNEEELRNAVNDLGPYTVMEVSLNERKCLS